MSENNLDYARELVENAERFLNDGEYERVNKVLSGLNILYCGLRGEHPDDLSEASDLLDDEYKERVLAIQEGIDGLYDFFDGEGESKSAQRKSLETKVKQGSQTLPKIRKTNKTSNYDPSTDYTAIVRDAVRKAYEEEGLGVDEEKVRHKARYLMKNYLDKDPNVKGTLEGGRRKPGRGTASRTKVVDPKTLRYYLDQIIPEKIRKVKKN